MTRNGVGRPAASGGGETTVMAAWEKFLAGDGVPDDAVRRMIEDSWRRCLDQGVSPVLRAAPLAVDDDGLESLQRRHAELIEAARPVMVQAREFLAESGTMMVLTDGTGVILWVEGDRAAKEDGQAIHLMPGALWDEAVSGTNAIGTALASAQPVQICAAEHFCEGIKHWTCSASVIRDPYDGRVLGALDISGLSGAHNAHCLALTVTGASRVESRLAKLEMEKRARLLDLTLNQAKRWGDNGLVVFDRRGRLVRANESAGLFLDSVGVELSACSDLGIAGLAESGREAKRPLPNWMSRDWLQPIIDQNERLGTVLAIPLSRRWSRSAEPQDRAVRAPAGDAFDAVVGASATLSKTKARARQLARLHVPVLLLGPTGAGKEVFARALHQGGATPSGPFVPLNCGGMTRDLLASELFGHVEGAFTGARRGGMVGKFEAADGGTLFLDEIGEMPMELQAHFLRVLEEGAVYRLGENKPRKVRVRLIAATNRDLRDEVAAGRFRLDLYYRLAVTVLRLPALAEHKEDIPLLVRHFIDQTARSHDVPARQPGREVLQALMAHDWPGNVRELRNVVQGMVLLAADEELTLDDLPPDFAAPEPAQRMPSPLSLEDSERRMITSAIGAEGGNLTRTAVRLGIAKSTLYEKMKRYGIERGAVGGEPRFPLSRL